MYTYIHYKYINRKYVLADTHTHIHTSHTHMCAYIWIYISI